MQSRKRWAIYLLASLMLLPACSGSVSFGNTLDTDKAEEEIAKGIEEQTEATIDSVECPDDVDIEAGHTFDCTVNVSDGSTETVTVTQDDDEGNITWELN